MTLTYKIKDFVKAIKLSFLSLSEKDQMSSLLLSRKKEEKVKIALWSVEWKFDRKVQEFRSKKEKWIYETAGDGSKESKGQSEISRVVTSLRVNG